MASSICFLFHPAAYYCPIDDKIYVASTWYKIPYTAIYLGIV